MTAKDWFGVVVRGVGLWFIVRSISFVFEAVAERQGWSGFGGGIRHNVMNGLATLVFGIVFLRGADLIVRFAYPEPRPPSDEDESPLEQDGAPPERTEPPQQQP